MTTNKHDVFQFVSIRPPESIEPKNLRHFYIQDEVINNNDSGSSKELREVFSMNSNSKVGKLVYSRVFISPQYTGLTPPETNNAIINEVLKLLESKPVIEDPSIKNNLVNELLAGSNIRFTDNSGNDAFYILPTKLDLIDTEFDIKKIVTSKEIILKHCQNFNRNSLLKELKAIFDVDQLNKIVFYSKPGYLEDSYLNLKIALFETLYVLYILRRRTSVNFDEIINGLQILHVLEYLAIDDFLNQIYKAELDITDFNVKEHLAFLKELYPELTNQDLNSTHFFYIKNKQDLINFSQATPIIHPIVAELANYGREKFNNIKPFMGDLKVVKQWLTGYKVGEISHIHNIMKGETKVRDHRYLEKTEDTFSTSSESSQSSQSESQSTDKFELKRETENVIKSDINVGANANMTYKYGDIFTAALGANFSYAQSSQQTQKVAANYAQEIIKKAVTNLQSKSAQQRSINKLYETEEKNNHTLANTQTEATHTSGIYRWLDKKYKAQVFNFGKRWMFEFLIPEPAAFYVTSKLKASEIQQEDIQKPDISYAIVKLYHPTTKINGEPVDLKASDITDDVYEYLRVNYEIDDLEMPAPTKNLSFINPETGTNAFVAAQGSLIDNGWVHKSFDCKLDVKGYCLNRLVIEGNIDFHGRIGTEFEDANSPSNATNTFIAYVNSVVAFSKDDNNIAGWSLSVADAQAPESKPRILSDQVPFTLAIRDGNYYDLRVRGEFQLSSEEIAEWQIKVYKKILSIEKSKVEKFNQELELNYNAALSDYNNKIAALKSQTVNEIIQGRSEAFNNQIIKEEIKKHCITMIAKEFDINSTDDLLSKKDAIPTNDSDVNFATEISYKKFHVEEESKKLGTSNIDETYALGKFIKENEDVFYPKIDIDVAIEKGKLIQFLEQAFEWEHIAYIFYPYFWAHESKWIELMNRSDYTDNNMTAFLKAGSARVMISVTPSYYHAVMHFLATREPWEGGQLPVLGDSMYIPIFEEIRKQQDNFLNATPEGEPWPFELPTSLVYLQDSSSSPSDLLEN